MTPIQVQNAACLGPASVGLPHHSLASQPLPPMAGPAAHGAAVSISRTNAPMACAAGASLASPNMTSAMLETEPSGRTVTILPGLPTSPESAASACGNSSAGKPDKDSKVRAPPSPLCYSLTFFLPVKGLIVPRPFGFLPWVSSCATCQEYGGAETWALPQSHVSVLCFSSFLNTLGLSGPLLGNKETTVSRTQSTSARSLPNLKEEFCPFK